MDKIEVIVVNDGSRDNSLRIAREYESLYPDTIIVIDKENGGHGSTINAALKIATGKYFRVIDSDDWVNVDDFRLFIDSLAKTNSDAVVTNYSRELAYNGKSIYCQYKNLEDGKRYDLDTMDLDILGVDYFYMATTSIKTSLLHEVALKLDENTFYVDMEYNLLPLVKLTSVTFFDLDIYRYWIGRPEQSINVANTFKNRGHHEKVLKRIIEFYSSTPLNNNKKRYANKIIILMLNTHYYIYASSRLNSQEIDEIRDFDKWLHSINPELYDELAERFTYIKPYRSSRFMLSSTPLTRRILHKMYERENYNA